MADFTEATPLSSPDMGETTGTNMDDVMLGDAGYSRGDISPGETGSGEGSGTDFTDFLTDTYTSEAKFTYEGSGAGETTEEGEQFTTVSGITESGVTEGTVEGSTMDSTEESTVESITDETSGGELTKLFKKQATPKIIKSRIIQIIYSSVSNILIAG